MEQIAGLDKLWDPFVTWQFAVASLFIVAVMTGIKRTIRAANKALLERGWITAVLTGGNMALGFVVCIPKDFLKGDTYFQRMFVGMIAGFASNFLYHLILKRFSAFTGKDKDDGGGKKETPPTSTTVPPI